jgi:vesicular inhibitory amino acid transporter
MQDMILSVLPMSRDASGAFQPPLPWVAHLLRLAIFTAGTVLGLTAYNVLGSMLSLVGGLCSLTCSLLLPVAFYTRLAWRRLGLAARAGLVGLLFLGSGLVSLTTAMNLCDLIQGCRAHRHSPQGPTAAAAAGGSPWEVLHMLLPATLH